MTFAKLKIAHLISDAIASMGVSDAPSANDVASMLEYPPSPDKGDLAFPCFKLSRTMRKAPPMIAADIKGVIASDPLVAKLDTAGGYLNFFLDKTVFSAAALTEMLEKKERFGGSDEGKGTRGH